MKYSYHWLKELSGTRKSAEQLSKLLMTHAFEVEGIEKFPHGLDGVTVGLVTGLSKHPNADKLRVAEVEVGKREIRQIVCGAPNIDLGQKVAVALPGTVLCGNFEIKETDIRGVQSSGMICSEKELGLGENHEGILVLPEDAPVGAPFAKYFELDDSIFDIKILPDRGSDALAYQGLSREIAALDGHAPRFVDKKLKALRIPSYNRAPKVIIEDKKPARNDSQAKRSDSGRACPHYIGIAFADVAVGESPLWLKSKLLLSGLRPINNVVDCTNYLMLLTGQPMHAFDMDKVKNPVVIRRAKKNEKLELLTKGKIVLHTDDLVIADGKKALALAGIMGGSPSSVTKDTKNIFLEIANFDAATVRRSKMRHNLSTDASYRFERGLDPNLPTDVAREAVAFLTTLTSGKFIGMRDVYPLPVKPWKISLSLERVEGILGTKMPLFEVVQYLALEGLKVKKIANQKKLEITVPTRRPDLRDEWDLIEEIGRMRGYDKIVPVAPKIGLKPVAQDPKKHFERKTKEYLAHAGFDEVMTYSFYGEKEVLGAGLSLEAHLEIENPLSPEQKYLCMNPVPLMLRKVRENLRHFDRFDCFEWTSVFGKHPKTNVPMEAKSLFLLTVLPKQSRGEAFFVMKGKVVAFFEALRIDTDFLSFERPEKYPEISVTKMLHPTQSACIVSGGRVVGVIGELHPKVLKSFGLEPRLAMAEFATDELFTLQKREIFFEPLRRFPFASRDLSLTFPRRVTVGEVEKLLREVGAPLLIRFELFDIYEKDGEKSLAFHLFFGAPDRTLSGKEMDTAFDRIVAFANEKLGGQLKL